MRKPTREEVFEALNKAIWGGGKDMFKSTAEHATDAVMALFEDKPTPKWEEEFDERDGDCEMDVFQIKDFIREKLREVCDDALACVNNADDEEVRKKWGL